MVYFDNTIQLQNSTLLIVRAQSNIQGHLLKRVEKQTVLCTKCTLTHELKIVEREWIAAWRFRVKLVWGLDWGEVAYRSD